LWKVAGEPRSKLFVTALIMRGVQIAAKAT